MRSSSASFSGITSGHKQTSNHLLAICGSADYQLQISLENKLWTQLPFVSVCRIYWAWLVCINHAHIFVDRNLKRTSPYLETHILVGVRLDSVFFFLRLAFLLPVSPSPRVRAKALHLPTKRFPFQDGGSDAVRGLLCRRGCRIIAELCRFPYQLGLLVGRHLMPAAGKRFISPTWGSCQRSLWADGDISLSQELNVMCLFLSLEVASYCSHFSISLLLSASQRYQLFHWFLSGRLLSFCSYWKQSLETQSGFSDPRLQLMTEAEPA